MHRPNLTLSCALVAAGSLMLSYAASASDFKVDSGFSFGDSLTGSSTEGSAGSDKDKAKEKEKEEKATEITATEETSFDERSRVATFIGGVRVRDAEFNLSCDKLTAHLSRGNNVGTEEKSGGLERAIAQGNVVIVQEKTNEKGEVTRYVGRAGRAEYVAATGDVTLSGWPQIQQGINNQVATEEGTVMILNRSGRLKTIGGSKTVIKDSSDAPKDVTRGGSNRRARNP